MSKITTHILDLSLGKPAGDVEIVLLRGDAVIARARTNADGRVGDWGETAALSAGVYCIRFETGAYFERQLVASFYPYVVVHFKLGAEGHYHVPLLISPFGYSTYRGS